MFVIQIFGLLSYWQQPLLQRENWRDLHATIVRDYPPAESIAVFAFDAPFAPWQWYDHSSYPTLATGTYLAPGVDLSLALKPALDYRFILVFDYLRTLTDPTDAIPEQLLNWGFKEVAILDQENIGFVRVYARPQAVISGHNL